MTAAAATTASARAGAAGGARGAGDIDALAGRLAKSNQDPDTLTKAMTGMGYTKSEARAAAHKATGTTPQPKPEPKPAPSSPEEPDRPGLEGKELRESEPVGFDDDEKPASAGFRMPGSGSSGTGLLIALVLYPAGLAFLRGGPAGFKAWMAAKFLNRVPGVRA